MKDRVAGEEKVALYLVRFLVSAYAGRLAEAYGVRGVKAEGPQELESALRESLSIESPTLIEVPVGPMPYPY